MVAPIFLNALVWADHKAKEKGGESSPIPVALFTILAVGIVMLACKTRLFNKGVAKIDQKSLEVWRYEDQDPEQTKSRGIAVERIIQAHKESRKGLDLGDLKLTSLPSAIGLLGDLRCLDIRNNKLQELTVALKQLQNLTSLNIVGNPFDHGFPSQLPVGLIVFFGKGPKAQMMLGFTPDAAILLDESEGKSQQELLKQALQIIHDVSKFSKFQIREPLQPQKNEPPRSSKKALYTIPE
jgi:hypothetical protein